MNIKSLTGTDTLHQGVVENSTQYTRNAITVKEDYVKKDVIKEAVHESLKKGQNVNTTA
jgi:hypothetical protein